MRQRWKKWLPAAKVILTVVIIFFLGRSLLRDLGDPDLWKQSFQPGWLAFSCLLGGELYVMGMALSALLWRHVMADCGHHAALVDVGKGYYIGMLGKYAPGKAWALLLRAGFVRRSGVPL